jgi:P4 family phage/plasmid primase-like protien
MGQIIVTRGGKDLAKIEKVVRSDWPAFAEWLTRQPPNARDKANRGWYCPAEFNPQYRHSENFQGRYALTLDYDRVSPADMETIWQNIDFAAAAYTTWSHTTKAPRFRVVAPLSRPATFDEFQAISRKVAARFGIELAARESHTPAQVMFVPTVKADALFVSKIFEGPVLDVDGVLNAYQDWTDRSTWPHRSDGDFCGATGAGESPLDKPGVVGEFCRVFSIRAAIERFGLPYRQGSSEDRWTYTAGSRPDGAVIYDDDTKLHSHHDTDPARGQHNAYDLVRLHLFGQLDGFDGDDVPLAERPSSRRMVELCNAIPELAAARFADAGFTDLGPEVPVVGGAEVSAGAQPEVGRVGAAPSLPPPIPQGTSKCSDLENARRIQKVYGKGIIAIGQAFYVWSGTHWVKDDAPVRRLLSKLSAMVEHELVRMPGESDEQKEAIERRANWAGACCSSSTLGACEKLLRSYLDFKGESLNADRALLTCRTGTIDLRTGEVRPHSSGDFITACAPTGFNPAALSPRFGLFLREIFRGDESVVAFAKRWFGYCITGEVREHAMVFHIGEGGNGKGKLMEALQHVLGPGYAAQGARSLLGGNGKGASPELADLMGRRMVTLTETNRDEEFNEGILKEITGGDRLKARNLYEGYFEFNPTHKLQIFTNNEPRITGQDRGIWRRLFLMNYDVKYGRPHEIAAGVAQELQDDELSAKLAVEAEGILAWLVEGAREWYAEGLKPPPAVVAATQDYKARQDNVGQFLAERTIRDPEAKTPLTGGAGSLYGAYKGWAEEMGCGQLGRGKFVKALQRSAPYISDAKWNEKGRQYRGFKGLRLTQEALL